MRGLRAGQFARNESRRFMPSVEQTESAAMLPSAVAAESFLQGKPGGLLAVLESVVWRSAIIGAGMYVAGGRERLLRNAVAGSLAVEVFVLWRVRSRLKAMGLSTIIA